MWVCQIRLRCALICPVFCCVSVDKFLMTEVIDTLYFKFYSHLVWSDAFDAFAAHNIHFFVYIEEMPIQIQKQIHFRFGIYSFPSKWSDLVLFSRIQLFFLVNCFQVWFGMFSLPDDLFDPLFGHWHCLFWSHKASADCCRPEILATSMRRPHARRALLCG